MGEIFKDSISIPQIKSVTEGMKDLASGLADLQGLSRKNTEIKIKTNLREIDDLSKVTTEDLREMFDVLNKQSKAKYFKDEETMINNLREAYAAYEKDVTDTKAESSIMLWSRAYEAMYGNLEKILPEVDKLQKTLWSDSGKSNGRIQFTVDSFKDLFTVMKEISARGGDLEEYMNSMMTAVSVAKKRVKSSGYVVTAQDLIDEGGIQQAILKLEKSLATYKEQLEKINSLKDEQDRLTEIIDTPSLAGKYSTEELDKFKAKIASLGDQINALQSDFDLDVFDINSSSLVSDITKLEKLYESIGQKIPSFFAELKQEIIESSEIDLSKFIKFGEDDANAIVSRISGRIRRAKETAMKEVSEDSIFGTATETAIKKSVKEAESATDMATSNMEEDLNEVGRKVEETSEKFEKAESTIKGSFSAEGLQPFTDVLKEIATYLQSIKETLGSVDDSNGFRNIIDSVDTLLNKLDAMYSRIGTGITNVTVNKGSTAGSQSEVVVSKERDRLMRSYDRIIKSFGGESNAFSNMAEIMPSNYGENLTEQLNTLYSSNSINKITNVTEQINRLRAFFNKINDYKKELAAQLEVQAKIVKGLESDLNDNPLDMDVFNALSDAQVTQKYLQSDYDKISKIKIPSSQNTSLNKKLNDINQAEFDINELEDDSVALGKIVERLEEIRNLLAKISSTSLETPFDTLLTKLDEIISKFDTIVSDVKVINETPIQTTPQYEQETQAAQADAQAQEQLIEKLDEVDQERSDDVVSNSIQESLDVIPQETQLFDQLADSANKAAEAKGNFADKNGEVLQSIIDSLSALNSEGDGFKNLNSIIENLANNENGRIDDLVEQLREIQSILNKPISGDSFIQSLKDLASQGKSLKDLATVLKASVNKINEAQKATSGKKTKTTDTFSADKKSASSSLSKLTTRINKLGNQELSDELSKVTQEFNKVGDSSSKLKNVTQSISDLTTKTSEAEAEVKRLSDNANKLISNYRELASLYSKSKSAEEGSESATAIQARINALEEENKTYQNDNYTKEQNEKITKAQTAADIAQKSAIEAKAAAQERAKKIQEAETAAAEREAAVQQRAADNLEKTRTSLLAQASALKNNGKLMKSYGDEVETMISELSNTGVAEERLNEIKNRLNEIKAEANQTGNSGKTFWQQLSTKFTSLATYLGSFASFYRVIEVIRKAYTNVSELNAQMIELAKVSEQTISQIKGDFSEYADVAKDIGATISDTISATADWARFNKIDPLYSNI